MRRAVRLPEEALSPTYASMGGGVFSHTSAHVEEAARGAPDPGGPIRRTTITCCITIEGRE